MILFFNVPVGATIRFNGCRCIKLDTHHVKFLTDSDGAPIDYSKACNQRYARTTQACIEGTPCWILELKRRKMKNKPLFTELLNKAIARNLLGMAVHNRAAFIRRAKRFLAVNLAEPGDCEGDMPLLIGLSLAQAEISNAPGWIPVVQHLGCEIARLA